MLRSEEEALLIERCAKQDEEEAWRVLLGAFDLWLKKQARDFAKARGLRNGHLQDLVGVATAGFLRAVRGYDLTRDARLSTYAARIVWQDMDQHYRRMGRPTTLSSRTHQYVTASSKERARLLETKPQLREHVAAELGGTVVYLDDPLTQHDRDLGDDSQAEVMFLNVLRRERETVLAQALLQLSEAQRYVIWARYLRDPALKLKEIGLQLSLTHQRIAQIEKRALEILKDLLLAQKHALL